MLCRFIAPSPPSDEPAVSAKHHIATHRRWLSRYGIEDRLMAGLSLIEVTKSFGALEVLHPLSLEIPNNEFLVLVGPSGCGKTTLLRMIAGLEDVTSGTIAIDGRVVNDVPPKDRDIAMVFQDYALYPHMTVYDNMAFGLIYRDHAKAEVRRRVEHAAGILNIGDYLARRPGQLSGGQRQRVAMGRAIVRDPKVFLFDEPLSNLDAKLRVQMRTEIKKLHKRVATTMIYVTHDQVEAMTLADRVVVMRDGHVEQIGTPDEMYNQPASVFVAGFIGAPTMNLVEARVDDRNGALVVILGSEAAFVVPVEHAAPYRGWVGRDVIFGLRPERLAWVGVDVDAATIEVAVSVVEPLGADTLVFFEISGLEMVARIPPEAARNSGDRVRLRPDLRHMHLFDPATGRRIGATESRP
jgi:multiple sugar transport system ATP-binding protein